MAGYNRVVLIGNLTRDPDYKQLTSGQAVCRLGLATNRQFKNRQTNSMIQEVCYIDIDVWGAQAESCRQYLQKGRPVLIEGRLKFDSWEDASGQTRSKHSVVADRVVFLSSGVQQMEETGEAEAPVFSPANQAPMNVAPAPFVRPEPQNEAERELFKQIDEVKSKAAVRMAKKKEESKATPTSTGEIEFKDQPPFEDELPF